MNDAMVAGAIVSGAYFGDKVSPLSDTTNLAPAMAGTDIFTHIKYMMYTTVPTMTLTLIIALIMGLRYDFSGSLGNVENVKTAIGSTFNINPLLFLVPVLLIVIIIKKVPPIPALFAGTVLGGIFAVIFQPEIIKELAGISGSYLKFSYIAVMKSMFGEVSVVTSNANVNRLLTTTGMRSG